MSNIILCAMDKEAEYISVPNSDIYVTGIGRCNAINKIEELINKQLISLDDNVINVGYAGSSIYEIGDIVSVSESLRFNRLNGERGIRLNHTCIDIVDYCLSADNFITNRDRNKIYPLVDMELYYIACLGFSNLQSFKIVSDNLNEKQYYNINPQKYWDKMNYILNEVFNGTT